MRPYNKKTVTDNINIKCTRRMMYWSLFTYDLSVRVYVYLHCLILLYNSLATHGSLPPPPLVRASPCSSSKSMAPHPNPSSYIPCSAGESRATSSNHYNYPSSALLGSPHKHLTIKLPSPQTKTITKPFILSTWICCMNQKRLRLNRSHW